MCKKEGDFDFVTEASVDANVLSYTKTKEVIANMAYSCQVKAYNTVGSSKASSPVLLITPI